MIFFLSYRQSDETFLFRCQKAENKNDTEI